MNLDIHICPTNLLTQKQLQEIAELKKADLNAASLARTFLMQWTQTGTIATAMTASSCPIRWKKNISPTSWVISRMAVWQPV